MKKMRVNKSELKEILDFSINTSLRAGELLCRYQKNLSKLKIDYKEAQGVVSKADRKSEELIIKAIRKHFKKDDILAEESAFVIHGGKREAYEKYKSIPRSWLIDPLDGTSNYLNGLDYYGVAISFCVYGVPVVGVILRPKTGELFYAIKGVGAFKFDPRENNKRIKLSGKKNQKRLEDSLFLTGFTSEKGIPFESELMEFKRLMRSSRAIRRFGSAALDLCYVAEGIVDGFWERKLAPWDIAAAGLICQEAHVKVTDYNGQAFNPFIDSILASRTPLYKKILVKLLGKD